MSDKKDKNNSCLEILQKMQDAHVLIVGDIMLDRFVYGDVERISPESPVPVLNTKREEYMCGGAGNALANLSGLGVGGAILSVIGCDEAGETLKSLIKSMGFNTDGLIEDKNRPTTEKTRFLAGHQQLLRTDYERKSALPEKYHDQFFKSYESALDDVGAVIISDYGKEFLTPKILKSLIEKAAAKNIPVLVDPKGKDFSIYKGATVVTPNKKELSEATGGMAVSSDEEVETAAKHIMESCGIGSVIATRSKDGMSVVQDGQASVHIRASGHIEVFDVSGAGDSVIATIGACMAAGGSMADAAYLANLAGSIVVTKVGTAPIRYEDLKAALEERPANSSVGSNMGAQSLDDAKEHVQRWKARGLKVGFTNGCFDILHSGHVQYLQQARAHCDRLVVGLNTDSSVRILKGADRPVHGESERAIVLSALEAVGMVVLFGAEKPGDDNTANMLIEVLKPDLYFKGGDYKIEEIPEAPGVQAYGGEVKIMPETVGQSTSLSIEKIKTEAA